LVTDGAQRSNSNIQLEIVLKIKRYCLWKNIHILQFIYDQ
jgi:hypothetical protein